mmetsp:Transcript_567/g.1235  ORF Transcript_567/g.1235 Transcript_567/m.1235 type:complete len:549 (+) Transcript_567:116-1762(+)
MIPLLVVVMLASGTRSGGAFTIETKSSTTQFHPSRELPTLRTSSSLFSSSQKSTISTSAKPRRRRSPKKSKPTARSVAISALANAPFSARQLEQDSNFEMLDLRDRAFARLLLATVERRSGQIDKVLSCCIAKYPPKKGKHSHVIQATLRTGVAQLLFLQTPPFAAIKESVQVLRMYPNNVPEPMIKFVNGVLRNLSRPPKDETNDASEMFGQILLKETSPQDNIAPWLLEQWRNDWGEEKAALICEEMMPSDESLVTPHIDLSTKYSLGAVGGITEDRDEIQSLVANLGEDSTLLPQYSIRVGSSLKGDVKKWPAYDDGIWWVQDASSTLPALVLTRALYDKYPSDKLSDIHVVDMCAAPGGKTSQILSAGFGHVTAIEASPRRSRRLVGNLERLGFVDTCHVVIEEGQNWVPKSEDPCVHGILVDVPCSATGTGARRPDVLRRDSDLRELLEIQEKLANHCGTLLDVGGIMVYATCSILKEESEDQVQRLIERGNLETLPIQSHEVPGFEDAIDENGWLRVLPGVLKGDLRSTDGFFVARLTKMAG